MSIIASIMGIIIYLINKLIFKYNTPKFKCIIWFIFIIMLLFPFSFSNKFSLYNYFSIKYNSPQNIVESINAIKDYNKNEFAHIKMIDSITNIVNNQIEHKTFVPIWLVIVILLITERTILYIMLCKNVSKVKNCKSRRLNKILEECKKKMNITKNIKLIEQDDIYSPSMFGFFDIKIIVTNDIYNLKNKEISYIFMHELSHYKRKDNFFKLVLNILEIVYWFNPIIVYLIEEVKSSIECATDELATKELEKEECKQYCRTIIYVAEQCYERKAILLYFAEKRKLSNRINNILEKEKISNKKNFKNFFTCISMILLIMLFTPTTEANYPQSQFYINLSEANIVTFSAVNDLIDLNFGDYIKTITRNYNNIFYQSLKLKDNINYYDKEENIEYKEKGEYYYKLNLSGICNNNCKK